MVNTSKAISNIAPKPAAQTFATSQSFVASKPAVKSTTVKTTTVKTPVINAPVINAPFKAQTVANSSNSAVTKTVSAASAKAPVSNGFVAAVSNAASTAAANVSAWATEGFGFGTDLPAPAKPAAPAPVAAPAPAAVAAPAAPAPVATPDAPEANEPTADTDVIGDAVALLDSAIDAVTSSASAAAGAVTTFVATVGDTVAATVAGTAQTLKLALADPVPPTPADTATATGRSLAIAPVAKVSLPAPVTATDIPDPIAAAPAPSTTQPAFGSAPAATVITGDGKVYYVDYAGGDNANSGTSTTRPWKHAPGDNAATGGPAAVALAAGDTIRFKGGVNYRGTIVMKAGGASGRPVIYTGTGYGTGSAIWDGGDPVTSSVPCPSASACGNAPNWTSLRLVTYKEPTTLNRKLFDSTGPLYEAQAPAVIDPFWDDDLKSFATVPVAKAALLATGKLENATLAAVASGQSNARLLLWVTGNTVIERKILSVSGSTITFDATSVKPYTDRDGKVAVVGSVKSVTKPGLFAIVGVGQAVLWPRTTGGSQIFVGNGRYAFELRGQSNITIHGFEFRRQTASKKTTREGVGVANYGSRVANIRIEQNLFKGASMQNGYGMVMLNNVDGLTLRDNQLVDIEGGSGFRFGGVTNVLIERNRMQRVGRTGIYMGGAKTATVRSNILADFFGVHGNGMSFYKANSDITVSNNCVYNSSRPLTYHGNNDVATVNNLKFIGNIFITSPTATSGVYSWGGSTRGVLFENNLALGYKRGMILNDSDVDVTVRRNRISIFVVTGGTPPAWTVADNFTTATLAESKLALLTPDQCRAKGYSGDLNISAI
jgi:hypothetical protein